MKYILWLLFPGIYMVKDTITDEEQNVGIRVSLLMIGVVVQICWIMLWFLICSFPVFLLKNF